MDSAPKDIAPPVQYEALKQSNNHLAEIQHVGDFALTHYSFIAENNAASQEINGITQESRISFESIQYLKDLPQDTTVYKDPIPFTNDSKGMLKQGNDLFIQIDHSNPDAQIVRATINQKQSNENDPLPSRVIAITGSSEGRFTCVVETGTDQKEVISIPREVMYQSQLLSQQNEILAGITDESTKTVVKAYIDSLQGVQSQTQIDQQTLIEAAKNSGQVTTESLKKFIEKSLPEKPDDIEFSEKRKTIIEGLGSHTVATKEDFVTVLAFSGPEKIATYKSELEQEIATKREDLIKLQGTEEGTRIQNELKDLHAKMANLDSASEFYKDPTKLENFVDIMSSGKLTKEEAIKISGHFENGEMVDAVKEMAVAKIKNLTTQDEQKLFKIFGMKPEQAMIAATGGALLLLIVLMMNGLKDQ